MVASLRRSGGTSSELIGLPCEEGRLEDLVGTPKLAVLAAQLAQLGALLAG
jgi:hypothetical protein